MSPTAPKSRTRQHVDREYGEQKWPAIERLVEEERRTDLDAGLPQILGRIVRHQHTQVDNLELRPIVLNGQRADMPLSGAFGLAQFIVQDLVAAACIPETELVVELGSGWGWHILSAWASGAGPPQATYVAAEYTAAGRRAASSMAELDGRLDFRAIHFDYHEPVLDAIAGGKHAVVFTGHSIEQIPHVEPELFEAICGVAQRVTCLHFEPVGWQVSGFDGRGSSRDYAERHDYNRNLVRALGKAELAGQLRVDLVAPDVFGINPENSTTVIRWHSAHPLNSR